MQRFANVLFVAGRPAEEPAFERAVSLCRRNQARLTVARCLEASAEADQHRLEEERGELERRIAPVRDAGVEVQAQLLSGDPAAEIVRHVRKNGHDLVIKPAEEHHGATAVLFGSDDIELMRRCPCPVWILRNGARPSFARILAAVDPGHPDEAGRRVNRLILELASGVAAGDRAELHVVHAWSMPGESFLRGPFTPQSRSEIDDRLAEESERRQELVDRLLDGLAADAPLPRTHLIHGEAQEVIPQLARDLEIDLIVMGTLCRTGLPALTLGNTAEQILREVDCSVLTVRPDAP